jgi:hypothetical protein
VTAQASAEARGALMVDNAARLYRLPGHENGFSAAAIKEFAPLVHL